MRKLLLIVPLLAVLAIGAWAQNSQSGSPEKTVKDFYAFYNDIISKNEPQANESILEGGEQFFTTDLYNMLIRVQQQEFPNCLEFDPFAGGQQVPSDVSVGTARKSGGPMAVPVTTYFGSKDSKAEMKYFLVNINRKWLIANICYYFPDGSSFYLKDELKQKLAAAEQ